MKHWNVVAFGKLTNHGFMTGKAFAIDADHAVELSGEPTAIAFPSLAYGVVANAQESFAWMANPSGETVHCTEVQGRM